MSSDIRSQSGYLQSILGAVPIGVVVVGADLAIQAFNAAAEDIIGVDPADAIGRSYPELLQAQEQDLVAPLREVLSGDVRFVDRRFSLQNERTGETRPVRHSAVPLIAGQDVVGCVATFSDISHQVALERKLEGQRTYLRDVLRAMPDGVAVTNESLNVESWNDAAARITGTPAEDALGQPCADVLSPTVASGLRSLLEGGGESITGQQARLTHADDKTPIGFSASSIVMQDDHEEQHGIVVFRDIGDRLAREREMAQQRHYLRQVLELAPYAIFTVDRDLTIQTFNQAAETLTGYAASFAVGKPYQDIVEFDPESGSDPLPATITSGGERKTVRLKLLDAHGKRIDVRYSAAPLTDAEGQVIGAIVIFQDIGDIVAAERTKNEFISMISHELRTPLTSIKGFITAILDGRAGEVNERQRHFLSVSREQSNRLLTLINDLLDLTSLESQRTELDEERISVSDLIQQNVEAIRSLTEEKNISLSVEVASAIPYLWGDEQALSQVLQNLLANAVKFTPAEGEIEVVGEVEEPDTVILSVSDTGVGIPLEEHERIFDPFYQVENVHTRHVGGTGLGLAIADRIVKAHDGRIELESEPGVGSTFQVCLPLVRKREPLVHSRLPLNDTIATDEDLEKHVDTSPRSQPVPQKPKRETPLILVVDDDESVNELIQFLLEQEGYEVLSATTAQQAASLAMEHQPDLITLDILMPETDGFDLLSRLKDDPGTADIPVCIVSIVEDRTRGYKLGAVDYVTKPFEGETLLSAVHHALDPGTEEDVPKRVLIVEDDPNIVELIELILRDNSYEYEIFTAYNGVRGVELLHHHHPDLVLLDIMLPKINGYEFLRHAKANPHTEDIPIVILSVRSLEEDISRALQLGAEKYLVKTDDETHEDLTHAVEEVVEEVLAEDNE